VRPGSQVETHAPSLQQEPGPQTFPQAPQLELSFWRSTHWPSHQVWPGAQTEAQTPSAQQVPSPQTFPHAPQLVLSF
jgi:hypothetical protein